ncbi:MAG: glycosyltransferase family 4 protein, partial [Candidatus Hodarchaeota archaeon]
MHLGYFCMGGVYPFNIGGTSRVAYHLLREFDKRKLKLSFIFPVLKKNIPPDDDWHSYFDISDGVTFYPIIKDDFKMQFNYRTLRGPLELANLSKKLNFDIVHYNLAPLKRDFLIPWISTLRNIPQIYTYHGRFWKEVDVVHSRISSPLLKMEFRIYMSFYDRIVVNSKDMLKNAELEGFNINKIEVIPNGVCIEEFENAKPIALDGNPVILFVGRLEKIKGVHLLIKVFRKVSQNFPESRLHLVGDGSLKPSIKKTIISWDLTDKVILHGFVPDFILPKY